MVLLFFDVKVGDVVVGGLGFGLGCLLIFVLYLWWGFCDWVVRGDDFLIFSFFFYVFC